MARARYMNIEFRFFNLVFIIVCLKLFIVLFVIDRGEGQHGESHLNGDDEHDSREGKKETCMIVLISLDGC